MSAMPTHAEEYAKLLECLTKAQESAHMLGHLAKMQGNSRDNALGDGWHSVGELLKRLNFQVTKLAQGKLQ